MMILEGKPPSTGRFQDCSYIRWKRLFLLYTNSPFLEVTLMIEERDVNKIQQRLCDSRGEEKSHVDQGHSITISGHDCWPLPIRHLPSVRERSSLCRAPKLCPASTDNRQLLGIVASVDLVGTTGVLKTLHQSEPPPIKPLVQGILQLRTLRTTETIYH